MSPAPKTPYLGLTQPEIGRVGWGQAHNDNLTIIDGWCGGQAGVWKNYANNETVAGADTGWTLAHAPSPSASLLLVQIVTGFGGIVLIQDLHYSLSGAAITTINSIAAGALRAWYMY